MSGEAGREVRQSAHEHGGQYRAKISFAAESDASTGGIKVGGLVKKVRHILCRWHCLTMSLDNYRENKRF